MPGVCNETGTFVCNLEFKRNDKTMADYLSVCLQRRVSEIDGHSSNICFFCIPKLVDTIEFLNTIKNSGEFFNGILTSMAIDNKKAYAMSELTAIFDGAVNNPLADGVHPIKIEIDDDLFATETETKTDLISVQRTEPLPFYNENRNPDQNLDPIHRFPESENENKAKKN